MEGYRRDQNSALLNKICPEFEDKKIRLGGEISLNGRFFPPKDLIYFRFITRLETKAQTFFPRTIFPPKNLVFFLETSFPPKDFVYKQFFYIQNRPHLKARSFIEKQSSPPKTRFSPFIFKVLFPFYINGLQLGLQDVCFKI